MEELYFVLQLDRHCIGHNVLDEVEKSGVVPEHGGEQDVVAAEHSGVAHLKQSFIVPDDVSDADLFRHCLRGNDGGLVERPQYLEVMAPVHDSYMAVMAQYHSPFFKPVQNVGGVEGLEIGCTAVT